MAEICLLYITDRTAFSGDESSRRRRVLQKIREAACAGVDYIQLREKDLATRDLELLAREAVNVIAQLRLENGELRTRLLLNSRGDVALAVQADGVHLRSNDISPQDVKNLWKRSADNRSREKTLREPVIGVSCHSPDEVVRAAAESASFAVFAPVFEKKDSSPAGLRLLQEACSANIPVLALGGITVSNAQSCTDAGAAGIAAIRLFQDNNIEQVVRKLKAM